MNISIYAHANRFYHGLLPVSVRQSHGHGASCFIRGHLALGEVGFVETMVHCRVGPCFSGEKPFPIV